MIERLANVIYWVCTGAAVLLAIGAATAIVGYQSGAASVFCLVLAVGAYGVGRAARYVLAGR
jgi:hypothetical protein